MCERRRGPVRVEATGLLRGGGERAWEPMYGVLGAWYSERILDGMAQLVGEETDAETNDLEQLGP